MFSLVQAQLSPQVQPAEHEHLDMGHPLTFLRAERVMVPYPRRVSAKLRR